MIIVGLFLPLPTDTDSAMHGTMDTADDTLQAATTSVHEAPAIVGERPAKASKTMLKSVQKTAALDSRKLTEANAKIRSLEAQVGRVHLTLNLELEPGTHYVLGPAVEDGILKQNR